MKEMSLTEHLTELRTRIIRIVIMVIVGFFVTYGFGEQIIELLLMPLKAELGSQEKIIYIGILDKVLTQFQLALWSSLIFTSPLWFHQLWLFIKPGLYPSEIRKIRIFVTLGFLLFWSGILFTYFIVFPITFKTILGFGVTNIDAYLSLKDYIVLSSKVLVLMGVLFQLPNLILLIISLGIITTEQIAQARRYVVTGFAVMAAMITPPDIITMMGLWLPMVCLFEIGLLMAKVFKVKGNHE